MRKIQKSTTLYPNPFSKAYWHDAAMAVSYTHLPLPTILRV